MEFINSVHVSNFKFINHEHTKSGEESWEYQEERKQSAHWEYFYSLFYMLQHQKLIKNGWWKVEREWSHRIDCINAFAAAAICFFCAKLRFFLFMLPSSWFQFCCYYHCCCCCCFSVFAFQFLSHNINTSIWMRSHEFFMQIFK